jgi:lysophospholipase L1-like esterase
VQPSRARRALYLSLPSIIFLCTLLAAEVIVRAIAPHISRLQLFVTAPEQHLGFTDKKRVTIFEGDPLLMWRLRAGLHRVVWDFTLVSTNAQHLRHPRPVGPKRPGAFRIVCLGDSVTFGYRVPVVDPPRTDPDTRGQPYPRLLEERLRAANPGREIEVIALAVPGYSSHQGRAWLRRDVGALQPDLVTTCFGWNDVSLRGATDRVAMPSDAAHAALRAAAGESQIVSHLALWLRKPPAIPAGGPVLRVPVEEFVDNHVAMVELARRAGASVAVVGPVYRDEITFPDEVVRLRAHRQALRRAMEARGIPYLEIAPLTETSYPENRRLFGEVIHPNAAGQAVFADALADFLRARGLLEGLTAQGS